MRSFLASIVFSAVLSIPAWGSDERLQDWLGTRSWAEGTEYCHRELMNEIFRRSDLRGLSSADLARMAMYCAALTSGQGDELNSRWWWYAAAGMDFETTENMLPEMRKLGVLQVLPVRRSPVPSSSRKVNEKRDVRLVTGEVVPGTPPRLVKKATIPENVSRRRMAGRSMATVVIEVVVSRDGVPREPLLVKSQAHPAHVLFAYYWLNTFRFEPAKVDGEPVECLHTVPVSFFR